MDSVSRQLLASGLFEAPPGQVVYSTSANWVVPVGVTSVSVLCVGGGGQGRMDGETNSRRGGHGGALSYRNNVAVTPGETLEVYVFGSGRGLRRGGEVLVFAAGADDSGPGTAESSVGQVKYSGGTANMFGMGGGGAAGYAGNGGNSSTGSGAGQDGQPGSGGGGGGGTSQSTGDIFGGGGGGVNLFGQGSNGAGGSGSGTATYGRGGSGGGDGGDASSGTGGAYGGGGGGSSVSWAGRSQGGPGAVRIIWPGNLRQFPSTRTANE